MENKKKLVKKLELDYNKVALYRGEVACDGGCGCLYDPSNSNGADEYCHCGGGCSCGCYGCD